MSGLCSRTRRRVVAHIWMSEKIEGRGVCVGRRFFAIVNREWWRFVRSILN
jgi:hypothetical protein